MTAPWALLRNDRHPGTGAVGWWRFSSPLAVLRTGRPDEVPALLREVEAAAADGLWAVGLVAYEAAEGFDPALVTRGMAPGVPAAWFGLFAEPAAEVRRTAPVSLDPSPALALLPSVPDERYLRDVEAIRRAIARGETYQANLTYRLRGSLAGGPDPLALFTGLHRRQPSPLAAFLELGTAAVCSVSPELFFRRRGRRLLCRPMKGTAPRGRTGAEDRELAAALRTSEKERAENLMIVDMVRNDLGRIARPGSVRVRSLFDVETHPTLHQMTSDVEAESGAGLDEVFAALFPSASVTGAPKVRTMEILAGLETSPRGVYTGAIGYVAPGGDARFSVAIRTAWIGRGTPPAWAAADAAAGPWLEYGTGGGVVWDSEPERELVETRTKALVLDGALEGPPARPEAAGLEPGSSSGRVANTTEPEAAGLRAGRAPDTTKPEAAGLCAGRAEGTTGPRGAGAPFRLLETLLWRPGRGFALVERHLARLAGSAGYFGFRLDLDLVERRLGELHRRLEEEAPQRRRRVRLLVGPSGELSLETRPLEPTRRPWKVALAEAPVDPEDRFLHHKTTRREVYERALAEGRRRHPGLDDVILWNPAGELTEATVANLVLRLDGELLTPPLSAGLLAGTLRAELLARGRLREAALTADDLARAEGLYLINSLRGWIPAGLVQGAAAAPVLAGAGNNPPAGRVARLVRTPSLP